MMRILLAIALGFALLAPAPPAAAQADISGTVEFPEGPVVTPGAVGRVRITLTNNGPAATTGTTYTFTSWTGLNGRRTIAVFAIPETPPCTVRVSTLHAGPGQPDLNLAGISLEPNGLGPGQSVSCIVGFTTFPDSRPVMRVRWTFLPIEGDPNLTNNSVFTQIFTGADTFQTVPTLNRVVVALLTGLALLGGAIALRSRQ